MGLTRRLKIQAQKWCGIPAEVTDHGPGTVLVRTMLLDTAFRQQRPRLPPEKALIAPGDSNPDRS